MTTQSDRERLRDVIAQAAAMHQDGYAPEYTLPRNPNRNGRPPDLAALALHHPDALQELTHPDFAARLDKAVRDGVMPAERAHDLATILRQKRREMEDARTLPGDWNGNDGQPHQPMPYAAREQRHPGYSPELHDALETAVHNADAADISRGLRQRMRENDPDITPTIWERADPNWLAKRAEAAREDNAATLRESIEASAEVIAPQEN